MTPFPLLHPIEPVELAPGVSMSFQVIPPVAVQQEALATGKPLSFLMGSRGWEADEEPRHRVVIPQPFYLGTFPVTQEEYACFREEHDGANTRNGLLPVDNVSWRDAFDFVDWLNLIGELPEYLHARLPCEAEWEYACRAGAFTDFSDGDGEGALSEVGWYEGNSGRMRQPVGTLNKNVWGLHDMHGNVWEWCADVWDARAFAKRADGWSARAWDETDAGVDVKLINGWFAGVGELWDVASFVQGQDRLSARVLRGGSWLVDAERCDATARLWRHPLVRASYIGFRVLLSPVDGADSGVGNAETGRIR